MSFFEEFKGYMVADSDIAYYRMNICKQCPFLTENTRCEKCGCFMKIKTKVGFSKCPIGKW